MTTTYMLGVDKGSAKIVRQIGLFIKQKGINVVHPRNEMEGKYLTSNEVSNLSRPRSHGLIAKVKGNRGNYCLTTKGLDFLRGNRIPKYAIISKAEGHQIGYFEPEVHTVSINDFKKSDENWEAINYTIEQGRVVHP
jgi:hypothetical protein